MTRVQALKYRFVHLIPDELDADNDLDAWGEHFLATLTQSADSPRRHELGVAPPLSSSVA